MATIAPDQIAPERIVEFDIYADARIGPDVQGDYGRTLAAAPPVFWTPAKGGHWVVTGYDEIVEVVTHPEAFSVREMQIPRVPEPPELIPLSLDPPDNIPYRRILMPMFSPKAIKALDADIRNWAIELLDRVTEGRTGCDFVEDVATVFPVTIFMRLMGMPIERLREFRTIADEHFRARSAEDFAAVVPKIQAIIDDLIALRHREPGDDIISQLIAARYEGLRPLADEEIRKICFLLFLGGMDTVTNVAAFSFQFLAQRPDIQAIIAEHPDRIPDVVDECLRLFGVISTPRLVVRECTRFGVTFRPGEMVLCVLAMGGRDARRHADPAAFDLDRSTRDTLAFSSGPHLCLGHVLARSELRILVDEWRQRVPRFALAPGGVRRFRLGTVNALESLPITWAGKDLA